jgi:hypothetical protein
MSGFLGLLLCSGAAGGPTPSEYVAYGGPAANQRLTVYPWNNSKGFGTAYGRPTAAQGLLGEVHLTSFVPDNSNIAVSFWVSPYFSIWRWSSLGFGTRYSDAASLLNPPGTGPAGFTWTSSVDAFLAINNASPISAQAWAWNSSSGFGSKYANSATLATSNGAYAITMNADSSLVAAQIYNSPWVVLLPWSSSSGFGTQYSSPSTLPPGFSSLYVPISFNKVTNDLAEGYRVAPYIAAYPTGPSGFGTKYSNPASALAGQVYSLRFSPNGSALGIVNGGSVAVSAYQWGGGFGTKYSDPSPAPLYAYGMDWESTNKAFITASFNAPASYAFAWDSGGFGSQYSNPSVLQSSVGAVSFSNQSR